MHVKSYWCGGDCALFCLGPHLEIPCVFIELPEICTIHAGGQKQDYFATSKILPALIHSVFEPLPFGCVSCSWEQVRCQKNVSVVKLVKGVGQGGHWLTTYAIKGLTMSNSNSAQCASRGRAECQKNLVLDFAQDPLKACACTNSSKNFWKAIRYFTFVM